MNREAIENFINEDVNPALEVHGGFISVEDLDVENGVLKIKMGGGCQGCAASQATLKFQVETYLKEEFPCLKVIEDVTDHSAGDNPYM